MIEPLRRLTMILLAALVAVPAAHAGGSFRTSDELLNASWEQSVHTVRLMVEPATTRVDPRGCPIPSDMTRIILDGVVRDRCPYIGDVAVSGLVLLDALGDPDVVRDELVMFARMQNPNGAIPASPIHGWSLVLMDYSAYWVEVLHAYVLRTGDLALARRLLPNVARVLDDWYPSVTVGGLVAAFGTNDYAYIRRQGSHVAYFSAQHIRALQQAAEIARWAGSARAAVWEARARQLAPHVAAAFWDPGAGAFKDTTTGPVSHPQDGNAFAVLAGLGTAEQRRAALACIGNANWRPYGNTINDKPMWDDPERWGASSHDRVYPFMTYFEALARYEAGMGDSALDVVRRTWGYMATYGPGTVWETIGPFGASPVHGSWASGWSAGAAPLLTSYVLGVRPGAPGYASVIVEPHPEELPWAEGSVTTTRGLIRVRWERGNAWTVRVTSPAPVEVRVPGKAWRVTVNGSRVPFRRADDRVVVRVPSGSRKIVVK